MRFISYTQLLVRGRHAASAVCWMCLSLAVFSLLPGALDLFAAESAASGEASAGPARDWPDRESPAAAIWDIGGQFRLRFEAKDSGSESGGDFIRSRQTGIGFGLFRTRVHIGWSPARWFAGYIEGQDARAVNDVRTSSRDDLFDLHQAYVRIGGRQKIPLSLTVGRQELVYGDQRFVGNSDWSNLGRSFDSVKLRFEDKGLRLDVFAGRPVLIKNGQFSNVNHSDWFSGIYAMTNRLAAWQSTDLFFLASNVGSAAASQDGQKPRDVYTIGTRWKSLPGRLGGWDYSFEAAGQFGSIPQNGRRLEHRAYAINATGGYTWRHAVGAPRLGGGYDFGSGDSNPADHRNGTFQLLFGTNHRFYGNMDLLGLRNMHIPRLEASFKPMASVSVSAAWLGFWLADTADFFYPESGAGRNENGYGLNSGFNSWVGQEFDLMLEWHAAAWGRVRAGYGRFFVGDYIRQSVHSIPSNGGAEGANWFYTQVSFKL
jgi:hypothetical protein